MKPYEVFLPLFGNSKGNIDSALTMQETESESNHMMCFCNWFGTSSISTEKINDRAGQTNTARRMPYDVFLQMVGHSKRKSEKVNDAPNPKGPKP